MLLYTGLDIGILGKCLVCVLFKFTLSSLKNKELNLLKNSLYFLTYLHNMLP